MTITIKELSHRPQKIIEYLIITDHRKPVNATENQRV